MVPLADSFPFLIKLCRHQRTSTCSLLAALGYIAGCMNSNFIDHVRIYASSGHGGAGCLSWRREKHVPKGGPDGGDGGRGGHIILRGNAQLWTLLDLRYKKHLKAKPGEAGGGNRRSGKAGEDIYMDVPIGTVVTDGESGEHLAEIMHDGEEVILLHGGHGGLGNWHFRSSTNQSPEKTTPGGEGEERLIVLELKLLADVGLVGFPNAGKSTLLSVLTAAEPKIADYAFTTIRPQLGMVSYKDGRSFVMTDIPGLIEGASDGRGRGTEFLRHIERCGVLLFMIPADDPDIRATYETLAQELKAYDLTLAKKPRLLAISKADLTDKELRELLVPTLPDGLEYIFMSSATGFQVPELKDQLYRIVSEEREKQQTLEQANNPENQDFWALPPHKRML